MLLSLMPMAAFAETPHTHVDVVSFNTEWTNEDSLPTAGGSYYLNNNVTLSQTWTVPEGVTINLCLNGFIINLMSGTNGSVIKVGSGATLNLYDCHNNGMITGGTGTLDVDTTSTYGGGVYVDYDGYNDIDGEWFSPIYRLR